MPLQSRDPGDVDSPRESNAGRSVSPPDHTRGKPPGVPRQPDPENGTHGGRLGQRQSEPAFAEIPNADEPRFASRIGAFAQQHCRNAWSAPPFCRTSFHVRPMGHDLLTAREWKPIGYYVAPPAACSSACMSSSLKPKWCPSSCMTTWRTRSSIARRRDRISASSGMRKSHTRGGMRAWSQID